MNQKRRELLNMDSTSRVVIAFIITIVLFAGSPNSTSADAEVISSSVTSEFPYGIRFKVDARSVVEITEIDLRVKVGQRAHGQVDKICQDTGASAEMWLCNKLEPATTVRGELFWRTGYTAAYLPPGVIVTYSLAIKTADGNILETEPEEFIYMPPEFEWQEISGGPVTVAFHGPVQSRAETILDSILKTIEKMEPALGIKITEPIRVTVFNNQVEMLEAQQRRSEATTRQTATLGQASTEEGVLIMIADRNSVGTASHEIMHILINRAGDSPFRDVPAWLNEGLAEYGNIDSGLEYDIALDFAVETDTLLPFIYMTIPPGDPEQLIIFYGQGKSIVRMMVQRWGVKKMSDLLAHHKLNGNIEKAIEAVYGVTLLELENTWREKIGAAPFIPESSGHSRPTPVSQRTIGMFSLTPQAGTEVVSSKSSETTSVPNPTEETAAGPTSKPAMESEKVNPVGAGCGAPLQGSNGTNDLTNAGLLAVLATLGVRRRRT